MNNITSQDYTVEDIIEYLSDKDTAIHFFKDHDIGDIESIHEIQKYKREYAHRGLFLTVKEKGNDSPTNIMIDIKWGQPIIEQVYSEIYENGSECTKRIIVFTGGVDGFEKDDPGAHEYVVQGLVNGMNDYPLGLYLIKASGRDFETKAFRFEVVAKPERSPRYNLNVLPSVEKFREAEFWCVYFDSLNEGFYMPLEAFDGCLTKQNKCWYSVEGGFADIFAEWTEDGLILTAKMRWSDPDCLINVFNSRGIEIQRLFLGSKIKFTGSPGESSEISIKVWNFPLKRLLNATSEEKNGYARLLMAGFDKFDSFIQDAVDALDKGNRVDN